MTGQWTFFGFDWVRFHALAPTLQAAWESGDFSGVTGKPAEEVLNRFDEEATAEEVCNALIVELCSAGDAVVFEAGLPELLVWLRRRPESEEAGELLGELVSARSGMQDWFEVEQGLAGMLTPEETRRLACGLATAHGVTPRKPARGLVGLARRFAAAAPAQTLLNDLIAAAQQAADSGLGFAVLRET